MAASPGDAVAETKRHLEARTTLYLLLKDAFAGRALGSEQFVYWDPRDPRKCLSPDVFLRMDSADEPFETWKVWERGAPDIAVEIVSASDQLQSDWSAKLERYEACGVRELVRFDAEDQGRPIRVWDRVDGSLLERAYDDPRLRACAALGHFWVVAPSPYGPQLRLARDREGRDLFPTPTEDRVRLATELAEERRARAEAEHDAALERAERLRAEEAHTREAEARALAERERDAAIAELARLRAERARQ